MQAVLEALKKTPVIKNEDIIALREYIAKKYLGAGINERAKILADAVHRIIDRHIEEFNYRYRSQIRLNLIQKAVSKNNFAINRDDILKTCIAMHNNREDDYTEALIRWVNSRQEIPVARGEFIEFLNKIHQFAGDKLEYDWNVILEQLNNAELAPKTYRWWPEINLSRTISWLSASDLRLRKYALQVMIASLLVFFAVSFQPQSYLTGMSKPLFAMEVVQRWSKMAPVSGNQAPAEKIEILVEDLLYQEVDASKLKQYLMKKNSILAGEPYLSAIIQAAKEFNVNPIFLIAITGQEQSFVPKEDKDAVKIANNPFNVYHSWMEYNTNIHDSARIASLTISNLLRSKPDAADTLTWINQHYCEDDQWQYGVSWFFKELSKEIDAGI